MVTTHYPPTGFFFSVDFTGKITENFFQSVTGLSVDMQTETLKEGGENRFEHTLPVRTKYTPLVLKRGLMRDSDMIKWVTDALLQFDIQPMDLLVNLLQSGTSVTSQNNESTAKPQPLTTWVVVNAWPKKWSMSEFNAEQNSLAIESIELHYSYFYEQSKK